MKTPSRQPAHMCACGWIHRLGSPTTCPLAAPTTAPLVTAPLDSGNERACAAAAGAGAGAGAGQDAADTPEKQRIRELEQQHFR